ncbi:hypothetical protein [Flagellimonas allohymeniacidonis]|uniref:Dihydroorotase n=1 Tax=Flagellimonas allohymeniacidonis TaxID=2517819 RepID=A0A4Q8QC68_9FLAO|nr:hypothetical protein [Allomuricauda hymeniacidonis]TAI47921.1 hypothetical protein EW142_14820 [Allomuricauda hymeniacidonis]
MKTYVLLLLFSLSIGWVNAQQTASQSVKIGDKFIISEPSSSEYRHLDVPRKNFIIKRGGIADMKTLKNSVVVVTDVSGDQNPVITFKRVNGIKFFRTYKTLTADLVNALDSKELLAYN